VRYLDDCDYRNLQQGGENANDAVVLETEGDALTKKTDGRISSLDLRLFVNIDVGKIIFTMVVIYCLLWS
jgi:hypothetical protein